MAPVFPPPRSVGEWRCEAVGWAVESLRIAYRVAKTVSSAVTFTPCRDFSVVAGEEDLRDAPVDAAFRGEVGGAGELRILLENF